MSFKDEVDNAGESFWKSAYEDRVTDILDACVDKIDELERDLDNVRAATSHLDERIDKIEGRRDFISNAATIRLTPLPEPVPSDRYCDLFEKLLIAIRERDGSKPARLSDLPDAPEEQE